MNKKKLHLPQDRRERLIEEVKEFLYDEFDEEVGSVKADRFIEFVQESLGKEFYNLGIEDSRKFLLRRSEDLEIEMDQLLL